MGLQASYRVAVEQPERYRTMGDSARQAIAQCGSRDVVEAKLQAFVGRVLK